MHLEASKFLSYPGTLDPFQAAPQDDSIPKPGNYIAPLDDRQNLSRQDITYVDQYDAQGNLGSDGKADGMIVNVKGYDVDNNHDGKLDGQPAVKYTVDFDQVKKTVTVTAADGDFDPSNNPSATFQFQNGAWTKIAATGSPLDIATPESSTLEFTFADNANDPDSWHSRLLLNGLESADDAFQFSINNDVRDLHNHGASFDTDVLRGCIGTTDSVYDHTDYDDLRVTRESYVSVKGHPESVAKWKYEPSTKK